MKNYARIAIVICLAGSTVAVISSKRDEEEAALAEVQPVAETPIVVAEEVAPEKPLPMLIDLGSTSCKPCKAMAPILDKLGEDFAGQFEVVFINVREDAISKELYGVKLIPTQIFLDEDGNELSRHVGFFSREDILSTWRELDYDFGDAEDESQES